MILERKPGEMVLEIGCGLHKVFLDSVGIDKSSDSKADIIRDVAKRGIPFTDNTFDRVVSVEVIEHIEHYEDLIFLINEIHRVTKNGGVWMFTTPRGISGLSHITHHRIFTIASFDYFKKDNSPEVEHMRTADGITAKFDLAWGDNTETQLEGLFTVVK